jgi:IMP dehydrogenase
MKVITAPLGTTLEQAKTILQKYRIENCRWWTKRPYSGLISVKDIQKKLQYPQAATDERGRLLSVRSWRRCGPGNPG